MLLHSHGLWKTSSLLILALSVVPGLTFAGNDRNYTYLALGDSVAFGLDPRLLVPPLPSPSAFKGYPEVVASVEYLVRSRKHVNAACPGETSGSFIAIGARDNGCNGAGPQGQPPFKPTIGLHTNYPGSQLSFAVSELKSNRQIDVVTLGIGSNDVLLLVADCSISSSPQTCVSQGLPAVLANYAQNLTRILTAIRSEARYRGTLILVKFYSPAPELNPVAIALNSVTQQVGSQFGARFAEGFTAFQLASALYGGDACKAGLLIRLSPTTCDIHPTPAGRDVLAATVGFALKFAH